MFVIKSGCKIDRFTVERMKNRGKYCKVYQLKRFYQD